jgi:hypothetical protein
MEACAKNRGDGTARQQHERFGREYEQHCAHLQLEIRTGQMDENTVAVATVAVQPESYSTEPQLMPVDPTSALESDIGELGVGGRETVLSPLLRAPYTVKQFALHRLLRKLFDRVWCGLTVCTTVWRFSNMF